MKVNLWVAHPRSGKKDTMLTLAVYSTAAALVKFLLNGVTVDILGKNINFGTVDAALLGALLVPTLGAYVSRKMKDSPDAKTKKEKK